MPRESLDSLLKDRVGSDVLTRRERAVDVRLLLADARQSPKEKLAGLNVLLKREPQGVVVFLACNGLTGVHEWLKQAMADEDHEFIQNILVTLDDKRLNIQYENLFYSNIHKTVYLIPKKYGQTQFPIAMKLVSQWRTLHEEHLAHIKNTEPRSTRIKFADPVASEKLFLKDQPPSQISAEMDDSRRNHLKTTMSWKRPMAWERIEEVKVNSADAAAENFRLTPLQEQSCAAGQVLSTPTDIVTICMKSLLDSRMHEIPYTAATADGMKAVYIQQPSFHQHTHQHTHQPRFHNGFGGQHSQNNWDHPPRQPYNARGGWRGQHNDGPPRKKFRTENNGFGTERGHTSRANFPNGHTNRHSFESGGGFRNNGSHPMDDDRGIKRGFSNAFGNGLSSSSFQVSKRDAEERLSCSLWLFVEQRNVVCFDLILCSCFVTRDGVVVLFLLFSDLRTRKERRKEIYSVILSFSIRCLFGTCKEKERGYFVCDVLI